MTSRIALATLTGFASGWIRRVRAFVRRRVASLGDGGPAAVILEARVVERTRELQDRNEELEAFSYSVSHDLRAPLRHIDGFGELLIQRLGAGDAMVTHYLDRIVDQAHQAEALIDHLLAFSRMGRAPLERHDVDVQRMVDDVVADLTNEEGGRDVHWTIDRLPHVDADPALLRVVWTNLLENALKYTRSRAIAEVRVGTSRREGQTSFFVRDNGVGFDDRFAGKLFGVFQRLHSANEFAGSGIGLATVRRIVARHAGHTGGTGRVDRGATFWFSLPDPEREGACSS
jgi:light-regulated signal transduction histidine kinase (bacteriophytochrome)